MKLKAIVLGISLVAASFTLAQDAPVHLSRHLSEGEVDSYKIHMTGSSPQGDIEFYAVSKQTVKKMLPDGGAQVSFEVTDQKVTLGGNEVPVPEQPEKTLDVDKNGFPKATGDANDISQYFRENLPYYDRDWKPGDVYTLDPKVEKGNATTEGTVKFVGVNNGDAEFDSDLTIKTTSEPDPIKVKSKTILDVNAGKLVSVDGSMPSLPIQPGFELTDVKFHLEQVKS